MDKGKLVRLVLIPIIIGLVVTLIVRQVLSTGESSAASGDVEMISVVAVAGKEQIPARTKLTSAHLILKQVPKAFVTGTEFTTVDDLASMITQVGLEPGEVVLRSRVVQEGQGTLPYRIPKGYRAMTIRIDELSGVAGHPEPGDLIDLVLFLSAKTPERPAATSRTLYESVLVLGKGPAVDDPNGGSAQGGPRLTSLTLALTPDAAVEVTLAEQIGHIKVLLRPALKEENAGYIMLSESRYLGAQPTR